MSRPTLAVALIVKNEAAHLEQCLSTVHEWVDEIVVLDSGSTDNTEEIAKKFTDKFYVNANWKGFGPQRQLAQSYVESDYLFWLDADERVTPELKDNIQIALEKSPSSTVFQIPRLSWVFGRYIKHSGWYPDRVLRLYPTKLTSYNDALVHEKVITDDNMKIESLEGDLHHYTYNNLNHYLVKSAGYGKAWADQRQAKGKKASLSQGIVHALACFIKMYVLKRGFLDGKQGFLIALLSAHSTFIKYADLWARDNDQHYKL
ncbi:glycosyl transferase, group 2 [Vibrio nigripulchritudo ATCC 27043]|uniref:glycosyltransferase family 2 protein n=1 Tax=Vibrio nigripulchritudo TaxID=28173 RepID=UPI00021C1C0E|nr:glycosyltransferase family 2 protein [Vibrio nigripulchritudo]EGU56727.1 glycosyl transferase, group 2 [Vibrio nigripulchritudo ATCC 27043]